MIKRILAILFPLLFTCSLAVLAAVQPAYGIHSFGNTNIPFQGDLSASGIGKNDMRLSTALWHNTRFKNAITNAMNPIDGSYLATVQYDLKESKAGDNFGGRRGYHVIPLDEDTIKDYVQRANGNAEWVWEKPQAKDARAKYYKVQNDYVYINLSGLAYLSGGGDPDMISYVGKNNGVSGPIFDTTFKTTPWPIIPELSQADSMLKIEATAFSIYDTSITGVITINDTAPKQLFTKNTPISNYSVTFEDSIPLAELSGLNEGENQVTLTVTDSFGRTATKTITITNESAPPTSDASGQFMLSRPNGSIDVGEVIDGYENRSGLPTVIKNSVYDGILYNGSQFIDSTDAEPHIKSPLHTALKYPDTEDHWYYILNAWSYELRQDNAGSSIYFKNLSSSPLPYVIASTILTPIDPQKHQIKYLKPGERVVVSESSCITFPSSLEIDGYWSGYETQTDYGAYVEKSEPPTIPKYLNIINALIKASEKH